MEAPMLDKLSAALMRMTRRPNIGAKTLFWLWPFVVIYYTFALSLFVMGWVLYAALWLYTAVFQAFFARPIKHIAETVRDAARSVEAGRDRN
jgi:uncharacterized membrane protein YciS (DUF1049 family)